MASSINASTSGAGGLITTADNTGILQLQSAGTTIATISSTGLALNTGNITLPSGAAPAFSAYQSSAQSAITAISDVPPPISTTMLPIGSSTSIPTPMAAAIGS